MKSYFYRNCNLDSQDEYWESPTILQNPLYSDDYPPTICNDENEFQNILENIYHVPRHCEDVLGLKFHFFF